MIKKLLAFIVLVAALLAAGLFYAISQTKQYVNEPILIEQPQLFTVENGTNFHRLMRQLVKEKIIESSDYTRLMPRLYPQLLNIRAGTYQLEPNVSLYQALQLFNTGKEHQFSITFVEGSRYSDWVKQLRAAPNIQHDLAGLSEKEAAKKLNIEQDKLEGLFLAETYHFTSGTTESQILRRAHNKLNRVLESHWASRQQKLPLKDAYAALILASIIEKETSIDSERARVSSVFINRLNRGMRLQTDPTVIYGMGDAYQGNIRKKDLRTPTPYNTYTINGLPPTPIAMAGEASIAAALNPDSSRYLYFVASGKGGHVFSKSLAEHNRAVRAYLKELRKNK
ncbi:endolytic transglycosylase MltG [Vibrio sagamiensis]|uniref:Endolytic murein transglycosylase n=1 Tax=Vibrio sagamiensis NBRC 104589 TaxID=1219064 RepID=A0A511QGA1_9VIBR|nr:endolytic transglycosylase MltG [Vibrio sagamiensis]PNQ69829.1 endolytic transglycosylase MltG [Vibrio agarivorans]GEM76333.1 aminodeoxychorismate lyase [Vibrio sagamiensis NBRC 104589]